MADSGKGAGLSLYAGVRVTLTDPRNGTPPILTVAVKDRLWGWDEWVLARPALRPADWPEVQSTREMLLALARELTALAEASDE